MAQLLVQIDPTLIASSPSRYAGQVVTALADDFPVSVENRRTFALVSCPISLDEARRVTSIDPKLIPPETVARIAEFRARRATCQAEAKAAAHAAAVPASASDLTTRELLERIAAAAGEALARGDMARVAELDAEQDAILAASRAAFRAVEDEALADLPLPDPVTLLPDQLLPVNE